MINIAAIGVVCRATAGGQAVKTLRAASALAVRVSFMAAASCLAVGSVAPGWAQSSSEPILIGGVGPLSIPGFVQSGIEMEWAMAIAVEEVNAAGGVLGRPLEMVFEDTAATPSIAAAVALRLAKDLEVAAVVGEYHSAAALAMLPLLVAENVPTVLADTSVDQITAGDPTAGIPVHPKNVFRLTSPLSKQNNLLLDWMVNGLKLEQPKLVFIYTNDDAGIIVYNDLMVRGPAMGVEVAAYRVQLAQQDYSSVVARAKQDNPDAQVYSYQVVGDDGLVILRNSFDLGLCTQGTHCIAADAAANATAFWRVVPQGVGALFNFRGLLPSQLNERSDALRAAYQERFGGDPAQWVYEAYDCVLIVADAINRAGSTDPDLVIAAIEQTDLAGSLGQLSFTYGSTNPVPPDVPAWAWHQYLNAPDQIAQYTEPNQTLGEAVVLWPAGRQTNPGVAWIEP